MTKKKQGATPKSKAKNVPRKNQTSSTNSKSFSAPAARGSKSITRKPRFWTENGHFVISHSEYVQDIYTDSTNEFSYDVFDLTPTNATTHPWLAGLAEKFELFRYRKAASDFRSSCPTTQVGKLIMSIDYDADDADDDYTKPDLLQNEGTTSENVWSDSLMRMSPAGLKALGPWRYVAGANGDARTSTAGKLFVATTPTNAAAATSGGPYEQVNVGELWIEYEVEFDIPATLPITDRLATLPQMQAKYVTTVAIASSTNAFLGMDTFSAPALTEEVETYALQIRLPNTAKEMLQQGSSSVFAALTTPLLVFLQDFEGMLTFAASGFTTLATTAPSIVQYIVSTPIPALGSAGASLPNAAANLANNIFAVVDYQAVLNTSNALNAYIKVAAGTAWRLAWGTYTASSGMTKMIGLAPNRSYKPNGDLLARGKIAVLPPPPVSTVVRVVSE